MKVERDYFHTVDHFYASGKNYEIQITVGMSQSLYNHLSTFAWMLGITLNVYVFRNQSNILYIIFNIINLFFRFILFPFIFQKLHWIKLQKFP